MGLSLPTVLGSDLISSCCDDTSDLNAVATTLLDVDDIDGKEAIEVAALGLKLDKLVVDLMGDGGLLLLLAVLNGKGENKSLFSSMVRETVFPGDLIGDVARPDSAIAVCRNGEVGKLRTVS